MRSLSYVCVLVWVAVFGFGDGSVGHAAEEVVTPTQPDPGEVLESYLAIPDEVAGWVVQSSCEFEGYSVVELLLTSQQWQNLVWTHQLSLIIPAVGEEGLQDEALLYITGGSNRDGAPKWGEHSDPFMVNLAVGNRAVVAVLSQVPNQPLFGGKYEDDLISHTFLKCLETQDPTWPLLLPMTKSAVRAMDAVQEYSRQQIGSEIKRFVVTGASKRGWTTWLTGASDSRVVAIAPMVIDVLNMQTQMDYQVEFWGDYSQQIRDYTEKGIQEQFETEEGRFLTAVVDPYSYRERLMQPKLILLGTNDPYWPVDAVKKYLPGLSGPTAITYVPNAGHGLNGGGCALESLAAFFSRQLGGESPVTLEWQASLSDDRELTLEVSSDFEPRAARVWYSTSEVQDFRSAQWQPRSEKIDPGREVTFREFVPEGLNHVAFYGEFEFEGPGGFTFRRCTRAYVLGGEPLRILE